MNRGIGMGENFYKKLPIDLLADFYVEIQKNIDLKILSTAMYTEIELIKEAAIEMGISVLDLATYSNDINKIN